MKRLAIVATLALLVPLSASAAPLADAAHPEAKPFRSPARATRDLDAALRRAAANGHRVIAVFGANWCHDSRALAGWFATPTFRELLARHYEVVWINVGRKDRNIDLARRHGLDRIAGTLTVLVLDAGGTALNLPDAPGWRNAASRKPEDIRAYFETLAQAAPGNP